MTTRLLAELSELFLIESIEAEEETEADRLWYISEILRIRSQEK